MKDFTFSIYADLLKTIKRSNYVFSTFEAFQANSQKSKVVVLRHDVDRLPKNASEMAGIEYDFNIRATYNFRILPGIFKGEIVKDIVNKNHELAYHYEDLTIAKGDHEVAIKHFERQLQKIREFYPSKTICMHGSPLTQWDNRELWKEYDYRDYGIIAEPYFDVDYSEVFYVTDTGRAWNNESVNVRDTVNSGFDIQINSTQHMIELFKQDKMPDKVIINTHPHRWFDFGFGWMKELVWQNVKNAAKKLLVSRGKK